MSSSPWSGQTGSLCGKEDALIQRAELRRGNFSGTGKVGPTKQPKNCLSLFHAVWWCARQTKAMVLETESESWCVKLVT